MPPIIEELKKLSNRDLKKRAKSLYEVIYQGECYGVNDMIEYELVIKELNLRGFEVVRGKYYYYLEKVKR